MAISTNSLTAQIGADMGGFQNTLSQLVGAVGGAISKIDGTLQKLNNTLQEISNISSRSMQVISKEANAASNSITDVGAKVGKAFDAGTKIAITSVDSLTKTVISDNAKMVASVDTLQQKLAKLKPIGTDYAGTDKGMKALVDRAAQYGVQPNFKGMTDYLASQQVNISGGATGLGTKFSIEFKKAFNVIQAETMKMQSLVDKAIKGGVQPTFKGMTDFLMSEGVRLNGATGNIGTKFSIEFKKAFDKVVADSKNMAENVIANTSKIGNGFPTAVGSVDPNARIRMKTGMSKNAIGLGSNAVPNTNSPYYNPVLHDLKQIESLEKAIADVPLDANAKKFLLVWEKSLAEAKKLEAEVGKVLKAYEPLFNKMLSQVPENQRKDMQKALIGGITEGIKKTMQEGVVPPKPTLWQSFFSLLKQEAGDFATYASYRFGILGRVAVHFAQGLAKIISERKASMANLEGSGSAGGGGFLGGILGGQGGAATVGMIAGITVAITALAAAAVVAALALGKKFADQAALATEKMDDMARVTGLSLTAMSGLEVVAYKQGESLEALQSTFIQLSDGMQQAAGGSELMKQKFANMGVNVIDPTTGKVKSLMQVIFELSASMKDMGNTSERNAKLMDLVGRMGVAKFIKMFGDGPEAIKEMMEAVKKYNLIQDESTKKMSEDYLKAVRDSDLAFMGLKKTLGEFIIGPMTTYFNFLGKIIDRMILASKVAGDGRMFAFIRGAWAFVTGKGEPATGESGGSHTAYPIEETEKFADSLNELQSVITPTADQQLKWRHEIEDTTKSMRDQIAAIDEQIITMGKGSLEAKKFSMIRKFEDDLKLKASREGTPESELAKQRAAFYSGLGPLLAKQAELDKLMGKDWQTEVRNRTRDLSMSYRNLTDSINDTITFVPPAEKSIRDYAKSFENFEKQLNDALIKAKAEQFFKIPGADKAVAEIEKMLAAVRDKLKDPLKIQIEFDKKALDEFSFAKKQDIENIKLEALAASAVTAEQRIQVEIARDILELRRKGVSETILQSDALKEQLSLQERIKNEIQQQRTFNDAMKSKRQNIEDMMLEVQATTAITKEDRIRIDIEKQILDLKRQGVEVKQRQREEIGTLAKAQQEVGDILRRQQELMSGIEKAIDSAIENMQTAFSDMWENMFNPKKGESWGKNFLMSVLEGWKKALSQIAGVQMQAIMGDLFKQIFGDESGGGIKGAIMALLKKMGLGKLSESEKSKIENVQKMIAEQNQKSVITFQSSVAEFNAAVSRFAGMPLSTPSAGPGTTYTDGGIVTGEPVVFSDSVFKDMADSLDAQMNEVLNTVKPATSTYNPKTISELQDLSRTGQLEARVQELQNELLSKNSNSNTSIGPMNQFDIAVSKFDAAVNRFAGGAQTQNGTVGPVSTYQNGDVVTGNATVFNDSAFKDMADNLDKQMGEATTSVMNIFEKKGEQASSNWCTTLTRDTGAFIDDFVRYAMSGFTDLGGFLKGVFRDVFQMASQWITKLITQMMGIGGGGASGMSGGSGGFGGLLGGLFGMGGGSSFGFGSAPAGVEGPAMANGGFFSSIGGLFSSWFLEKGGMMSGSGLAGIINRPTRILHYAGGGMAPLTGLAGAVSMPTMVNIGENAPSQFEAVVPLPDNKSIPVKFMGGNVGSNTDQGGGGDTNHVIDLQVTLSTPVVDPTIFQPTGEQIVRHVKANYDGNGELRTTIREDMGKA